MRTFLRHQVWPAVASLALLTLITGFIYPGAVTAVAGNGTFSARSSWSTGRLSARA